MIEVPKTQSKTKMQISIRRIFERGSSLNLAVSSSGVKNLTSLIALSENVVMTVIVENTEQLSNEQIEKQLRMIDEKKRRVHLKFRLAETKAKKVAKFSIFVATQAISKPFRDESEASTLTLKKGR